MDNKKYRVIKTDRYDLEFQMNALYDMGYCLHSFELQHDDRDVVAVMEKTYVDITHTNPKSTNQGE